MNLDGNIRKKQLLFLFLSFVEGLLVIIWLLFIPTDEKNAFRVHAEK